jgi:hypothetical protein
MEPFLKSFAAHLNKTYSDDLENIAVVLPSKRGKLFFKTYLAKEMKKPTWAPAIFSIDEFTEEISGLKKADPLNLMLDLYEVFLKLNPAKAGSTDPSANIDFREFCSWGSVMLQDINEIDAYLVNADELFAYLSETKAIQLWNPDGERLTEFQQKYLEFWKSLGSYYQAFREKLLTKRSGYAGLIFRKASENIEEAIKERAWKKVVFAGFNALTPSEEKIIRHLKAIDLCETCWDGDEYYVSDKYNEAGKFLRSAFSKGLNTGDVAKWISSDMMNSEKKIRIISTSQNTAQPLRSHELRVNY